MDDYISRARTDIDAPPGRVWELLTQPGSDPDIMFGAEVVSDWQVGSPIRWKGEWEGKPFEDKGEIIAIDPPSRLVVTHFSPMSGEADSSRELPPAVVRPRADRLRALASRSFRTATRARRPPSTRPRTGR